MITKWFLLGISPIFFLAFSAAVWADVARCKIEIEDVNKGITYNVEHKFTFNKGGEGKRKYFETPGNDYSCNLAFFELNNGTALSCGYKKDFGQTYFQSDRSTIKDTTVTNNLTFRHNNAFISIETKCE